MPLTHEEKLARRREAYKTNGVKAYNQKWKDEHREHVREKERGYAVKARAENPQKFRDATKRYAEKNPEVVKERVKDWVSRNPKYHSNYTHQRILKNYIGFLLYNCKRRAAKLGVPFDLVREDIMIPEVCPVLGIPIEMAIGRGTWSHNSPSVDRVIPELGYIKRNIRIISARANNLKNDGTPDELEKVAAYARREYERVK
jgi:hypothetical protein